MNECGDSVEASEIKAASEQLILKRSQIIKELRTRGDQWREFEQVCREIVELDRRLERDIDRVTQAILKGVLPRLMQIVESGRQIGSAYGVYS